jgi:TIR domain
MERLVFISYRRERGYALAHLVNAELRSRGLRTFLDVAESDPGQFWPQAQAAIRSCCAVVLICTNGSFQERAGDDWVLREISEAMALGRPIVPVFSQDFEPPTALPPPLAQAIEYNGVSMDTQFHVAAFDHLSQLVGGRKRSEQRRRVAILRSLALLTLLVALALGARAIIRLNEEVSREREARQAASARSEELAQDITAIEKKRAEERRAADQRQRQADARSEELAQDITAIDKKRAEERRAADQRQRQADARSEELGQDITAIDKKRAEERRQADAAKEHAEFAAYVRRQGCIQACHSTRINECHYSCEDRTHGDHPALEQCENTCEQYETLCKQACQ